MRKIESAGFHVQKATSFVSFLLPFMVLARMRYLIPSKKTNFHLEFQLGNMLNNILESVMSVELSLIRAGMGFCFGGSLFVVATKE